MSFDQNFLKRKFKDVIDLKQQELKKKVTEEQERSKKAIESFRDYILQTELNKKCYIMGVFCVDGMYHYSEYPQSTNLHCLESDWITLSKELVENGHIITHSFNKPDESFNVFGGGLFTLGSGPSKEEKHGLFGPQNSKPTIYIGIQLNIKFEEKDGKLCVVCLDKLADIANLPCSHITYCKTCYEKQAQAGKVKCAECTQEILRILE